MRLNFIGDLSGLEAGIRILAKHIGFDIGEGMPVTVECRPGGIEAKAENGTAVIRYESRIHFFRGLGLLVEALREKDSFVICETSRFMTNGIMLDVSRNAVYTVGSIQKLLLHMALMGLNMLMLYAEDTYEVPSQPYFGYMRGKYSQAELKECDDYADLFGIEIIPCIQTLAHLYAAIKWGFADGIRDTGDILLAGEERTYAFIEEMIKAASAPFRSKRIHIGMDEAHSLGLGRYLDLHGYQNRLQIMNDHLVRVVGITDKYGLRPMIWSDMYFRLASQTGAHYSTDFSLPGEILDKLPKNVQMVYWHYDSHDVETYADIISKHKTFGSTPVFAGGIYVWCGMAVQYSMTFSCADAALAACKREGVSEVFATMWGDDGTETNYFSGLLGMQYYAEHGYSETVDMEKLKKRFRFCVNADAEDFIDISRLDILPGTEDEKPETPANPSKFLLWQDVLLGLFDKNIEGCRLTEHYSGLMSLYKGLWEKNEVWRFVFGVPYRLCAVLALKCEMGIRLKDSYDRGDLDALRRIAEQELPELRHRAEALRDEHREQWLLTCKPFGWEILDLRYGGLLSRIETAVQRLEDYLSGKIEHVGELEEERLEFNGIRFYKHSIYGSCNLYTRIASASAF